MIDPLKPPKPKRKENEPEPVALNGTSNGSSAPQGYGAFLTNMPTITPVIQPSSFGADVNSILQFLTNPENSTSTPASTNAEPTTEPTPEPSTQPETNSTESNTVSGDSTSTSTGDTSTGGTETNTGSGTDNASSGDGSSGNGTVNDTGNGSTETSTGVTYGEWLEQQRNQIEANRKAAIADAQFAYNQNTNPYGVTNERLGASGLAKSGYGEYLQSKAYTQYRDDVQAAERLAASSNQALDAKELEHDEAMKTQYAQFLASIADGTIDASFVDKIGEAVGLTPEQIGSGQSVITANSYYSALENGTLDTKAVDADLESGKISPEVHADLIAKWNNSLQESSFIGSDGNMMSYTDAKEAVDDILNNPWTDEDVKTKLQSIFNKCYAADKLKEEIAKTDKQAAQYIEGTVVDINSSDYNSKQWGKFNDIDDADSGQGKYIAAILKAVENGDLKPGQYVIMNYGQVDKDKGVYIYAGDGIFVKCEREYLDTNSAKGSTLYLPPGYFNRDYYYGADTAYVDPQGKIYYDPTKADRIAK